MNNKYVSVVTRKLHQQNIVKYTSLDTLHLKIVYNINEPHQSQNKFSSIKSNFVIGPTELLASGTI